MAELPPESAHTAFEEAFKKRDIEGLLALYEEGASFVDGDGSVRTGKAAIRTSLEGFLALGGTITLKTRYAIRAGDLALLSNDWKLSTKGADGKPVEMGGRTVETVRRQADGRWLYVIDHPNGAE
jgi:uncharacterized protein (TIGR02246 family)